MKIEEMADIFLNLANFATHVFLNLAPPSRYALNLKALIKVSKVSWTSQLSYEILRSSLEWQFDKTNFISPKSIPPKSPGLLGLRFSLHKFVHLKFFGIQFKIVYQQGRPCFSRPYCTWKIGFRPLSHRSSLWLRPCCIFAFHGPLIVFCMTNLMCIDR